MSSVLSRSPAAAPRPRRSSLEIRALAAELAPVALLTAIAFGLRVSQLHQTLIGDEVSTYQDIFGHSFRSVLSTVHTGAENSPPLYFLLAWASLKLGDPTVWIRLPSLLLSTATVPVVYAIGRATVGRVAGLIGAAIFALTPFAVYYGIEARPYATMTFFVAFSTLALLHAVKTRSARWWLLYVLSAVAAAYSHYTSIFVLAVQGAWALWSCRGYRRQPLIANASAFVLYLPWLPHLRGKALAVIGQLYPLGTHRVLTDLLRPFPGHPAAPIGAIPTVAGVAVVGAGALAGLIALFLRWRRRPHGAGWLPSHLGLLTALAAATPIGLLLYSLLVTDLWLPRGLSASLPSTALVFGALLASLPRRLTAAAAAALIVTLVAGTIRSFDAAYARGPFRAIATYLDRVAKPSEPIAIVSYIGVAPLDAEFQKPHVVLSSIPAMWARTPSGGSAYVVLDDLIARVFKVAIPHRTGFQLVADEHYAGNFGTALLIYRRTAGPR